MRMYFSFLFIVLGICISPSVCFMASENPLTVELNLQHWQLAQDEISFDIISLFDPISIDREANTVHLLVDESDIELASIIDPAYRVKQSTQQIRNERIDSQYLDPDEVNTQITQLAATYPLITQLVDLGLTEENRSILGLKITDNPGVTESNELGVILMGGINAREIMSIEIVIDAAEYLTQNYSTDPTVNNWIDNLEIWIVPLINPDGNAYCWSTDIYWIKNRADNGDGSLGVNLEHNFDLNWGICYGSSSYPESDHYRGENPESEYETQAIANLIRSGSFAASISYRSFNELVLMPYGCPGLYTPDRTPMNYLGSLIAGSIQREDGSYGYGLGTWWEQLYPNDGVETDWMYASEGVFCYAIQVNTSYYPDYSLRDITVTRNRAGWQTLFESLLNMPKIHGRVLDACDEFPVNAEISISGIEMTSLESPRHSDPDTGFFHWLLNPGHYTLTLSADGYIDCNYEFTLTDNPIVRNFHILPENSYGLAYDSHIIDDLNGDQDHILDPGETSTLGLAINAPGLPVTEISATLISSDSYIEVIDDSADFLNLCTGQTGWAQGNCFQIYALPETPENHLAEMRIEFHAAENLCTIFDTFYIPIRSTNYLCPFWQELFESDPAWSIDNGDNNGWEFGEPSSGPNGAYTGLYVYGTNLDGNYGDGPYRLTAPPIDCSSLIDTELQFARYLRNEEDWDLARIDISNNGSSWHTVTSGYAQDSSWQWQEYDISEYADGQPYVQLRFSLLPDTIIFDTGFYIDDVQICGMYDGALPTPATPTPFPTFTPGTPPSPSPTSLTPTIIPTFTPSITPTITPTSIITGTPTPTHIPPNTPSPSAIPSSTPTQAIEPTPTPTPDSGFFNFDLRLNDSLFTSGDFFNLETMIKYHGSEIRIDMYIILDVYGEMFFWPTWRCEPDFQTLLIPDNYDAHKRILSFTWPPNTGSASGLKFYAGCCQAGTTLLLGDVDHVTFNYY